MPQREPVLGPPIGGLEDEPLGLTLSAFNVALDSHYMQPVRRTAHGGTPARYAGSRAPSLHHFARQPAHHLSHGVFAQHNEYGVVRVKF